MDFLSENYQEILKKIGEHISISLISLLLGVLVAVPLGIILTRRKRASKVVVGLVSVLQTIPSLALLALMIPIFGVGRRPSIIALFIYSLLPILRNTMLGIEGVDEEYVDVAKGLGMTDRQILFKVQLPLAVPVIMSGIRLSAVYVVSWATLASYIGGGGLGDLIFNGLNLYQPEWILSGTIPVTILAFLTDFILGRMEKKLSPSWSVQVEG